MREKYTAPGKLGIRGSSNGGLLITASLTRRPDLPATVIAEVPTTDNRRKKPGRHRARDGRSPDSTQFHFRPALSPLPRLKKTTCYPARLLRRCCCWPIRRADTSMIAARRRGSRLRPTPSPSSRRRSVFTCLKQNRRRSIVHNTPSHSFSKPLYPGKIFGSCAAPRCFDAISLNTARKSVVSARSRPS